MYTYCVSGINSISLFPKPLAPTRYLFVFTFFLLFFLQQFWDAGCQSASLFSASFFNLKLQLSLYTGIRILWLEMVFASFGISYAGSEGCSGLQGTCKLVPGSGKYSFPRENARGGIPAIGENPT